MGAAASLRRMLRPLCPDAPSAGCKPQKRVVGHQLGTTPHSQTCWHPEDPERWDKGGTRVAFSPKLSILCPCPGTSDELPVGHPGDAGLGAAHCGTQQLQPLAPAQGDVCGQVGEGGQGVDGEGEPANGPPSRVHRSAGVASSIPFLYKDERSSVILSLGSSCSPGSLSYSSVGSCALKNHSLDRATFSSPH